jgi:uncharacterized protein YbjT (DUF2867 family)
MRILVTGATSQTGNLAVRALLREGYAVRCLVYYNDKGEEFLPAGIEVMHGDLEKPETVRPALDGVDAVAQIAHIRFAPSLIAECEKSSIRRVIFFSSTRRFTKFDCPTKRMVEEGERAIEASALDYTILRPAMIYGSARDNNVSLLIAWVRRHRFFPLVGGGGNLIQPVFTLDVVTALVEAVKRPAAICKSYTLAGPDPMTYRAMVETIARAVGRRVTMVSVPLAPTLLAARCYQALVRKPRVTTETIERFGEDRAFDIEPARRDLGFNPISFDEGVRRQLAGEIDAVWARCAQGER